jgi:hypothetical protein
MPAISEALFDVLIVVACKYGVQSYSKARSGVDGSDEGGAQGQEWRG